LQKTIQKMIFPLNISYETQRCLMYELESLEGQQCNRSELTFFEDFSISGLQGNYGIIIFSQFHNPLVGYIITTIDSLGNSKTRFEK
jgi:hypothetical protein